MMEASWEKETRVIHFTIRWLHMYRPTEVPLLYSGVTARTSQMFTLEPIHSSESTPGLIRRLHSMG